MKTRTIVVNGSTYIIPYPRCELPDERNGWRAFKEWKHDFQELNPSVMTLSSKEREGIYNEILRSFGFIS